MGGLIPDVVFVVLEEEPEREDRTELVLRGLLMVLLRGDAGQEEMAREEVEGDGEGGGEVDAEHYERQPEVFERQN